MHIKKGNNDLPICQRTVFLNVVRILGKLGFQEVWNDQKRRRRWGGGGITIEPVEKHQEGTAQPFGNPCVQPYKESYLTTSFNFSQVKKGDKMGVCCEFGKSCICHATVG